MAIVVIGGQTKNIGKTSVVAGVIKAFPEMRWTAFKITQCGHGMGSEKDSFAITEERGTEERGTEGRAGSLGTGLTDSARYLEAGAVRSFWMRTRMGQLAAAMPRIREEMAAAENVVIESNSILRFLRPDVYLSVLDPGIEDFKESARFYLDRADAVLVPRESVGRLLKLLEGKTVLAIDPPEYVTEAVVRFLAGRLGRAKF